MLVIVHIVRCKDLPLFFSIAIAFRKLRRCDFRYSIWEEVQNHKRHTGPTRYSAGNGEVCVAFDMLGVCVSVLMVCNFKCSFSFMFALLQTLSSAVVDPGQVVKV